MPERNLKLSFSTSNCMLICIQRVLCASRHLSFPQESGAHRIPCASNLRTLPALSCPMKIKLAWHQIRLPLQYSVEYKASHFLLSQPNTVILAIAESIHRLLHVTVFCSLSSLAHFFQTTSGDTVLMSQSEASSGDANLKVTKRMLDNQNKEQCGARTWGAQL